MAVRVRHPASTLGREYCCCCCCCCCCREKKDVVDVEVEDAVVDGADEGFFRTWRRSSRATWDGTLLDIFQLYFGSAQAVAKKVIIGAEIVPGIQTRRILRCGGITRPRLISRFTIYYCIVTHDRWL